jgi:hypothetical protein
VDRVDSLFLGDGHDAIDVEIGSNRLAGLAHQICLIGLEAMKGEAVFVGVDRHGANAKFVGGAKHPDRDLAAVGDEEFLDRSHAASPLAVGPERKSAMEIMKQRQS